MSLGLNILLIFIFLLLGSVFAGTELALVSLRGSQIDQVLAEVGVGVDEHAQLVVGHLAVRA